LRNRFDEDLEHVLVIEDVYNGNVDEEKIDEEIGIQKLRAILMALETYSFNGESIAHFDAYMLEHLEGAIERAYEKCQSKF
ncbi:MAG: hypothetical protein RIQ56_157, partial [Candidatus Parcubacteria bacterium]